MSQEVNFSAKAIGNVVIIKEIENKVEVSGYDFTSKDDKDQKFRRGIVQSVGFNCPKDENGVSYVKAGDDVLFDYYKATDVTINNEKYVLSYITEIALVF